MNKIKKTLSKILNAVAFLLILTGILIVVTNSTLNNIDEGRFFYVFIGIGIFFLGLLFMYLAMKLE